jgi:hypothetical protein
MGTPAATAGVQHGAGIDGVERQRLLAEHRLAGGGRGLDLRAMQRMRRGQHHGLDGWIGQHLRLRRKPQPVLRGEIRGRRHVRLHGAREAQPAARGSTSARPQRPSPKIAASIMRAPWPDGLDDGGTVEVAADQRDRVAQQLALRGHHGQGLAGRAGRLADHVGVLERLGDARFRPEVARGHLRALARHHGGGGGAARQRRQEGGGLQPQRLGEGQPSASAARLSCSTRLMPSLTRAASPAGPNSSRSGQSVASRLRMLRARLDVAGDQARRLAVADLRAGAGDRELDQRVAALRQALARWRRRARACRW